MEAPGKETEKNSGLDLQTAFNNTAIVATRALNAAWKGAVAGAVIFGFLGGFRPRTMIYAAFVGAAVGAGREIYKAVRGQGPKAEP